MWMGEIGWFVMVEEVIKWLWIFRLIFYFYVSCGLICLVNIESGNIDLCWKVYVFEDIDWLIEWWKLGWKLDWIVVEMFDFGLFVLEFEFIFIENGSLFYRGRNVVEFVEYLIFEEVVVFLWGVLDVSVFKVLFNLDYLMCYVIMIEGWDWWLVIFWVIVGFVNIGIVDFLICYVYDLLFFLKGVFFVRVIGVVIVCK